MKLFNKKKDNDARKEISNERVLVPAIKLRRPYEEYHLRDYVINDELLTFERVIDYELGELNNNAAIDEGNADVLDQLIEDVANRALKEIARQKAEHEISIAGLGTRYIADPIQFQRNYEDMKEQLKELDEECDDLKRRNKNNKFDEGGAK